MTAHNASTPDYITCRACGKTAARRGNNNKFCAECGRKEKKAREAEYARQRAANPKNVACPKCGKTAPRYHGNVCRECRRADQNERAKLPHRKQQRKEYFQRPEVKARNNAWGRRRYSQNFGRRIADIVRGSIRRAITRNGGAKAHRTAYYLGYPVTRLVEWARANGYNPPETHIDHRVPVSFFLAQFPDDPVRACRAAWNLANLRVIPARDNLTKGARRIHLC